MFYEISCANEAELMLAEEKATELGSDAAHSLGILHEAGLTHMDIATGGLMVVHRVSDHDGKSMNAATCGYAATDGVSHTCTKLKPGIVLGEIADPADISHYDACIVTPGQ